MLSHSTPPEGIYYQEPGLPLPSGMGGNTPTQDSFSQAEAVTLFLLQSCRNTFRSWEAVAGFAPVHGLAGQKADCCGTSVKGGAQPHGWGQEEPVPKPA